MEEKNDCQRHFVLEPITEDRKVLYSITTGLRECEHLQTICPEMSLNIDKVKWALSNKQENSQEEINDRINLLKEAIGTYWEVNDYYKDKICDTYLMFPYLLIEQNYTYWFVKGYLSDYQSGMQDTHIYIQDTLNHKFEFNEISKEDFVRLTNLHVNEVLNRRLQKL